MRDFLLGSGLMWRWPPLLLGLPAGLGPSTRSCSSSVGLTHPSSFVVVVGWPRLNGIGPRVRGLAIAGAYVWGGYEPRFESDVFLGVLGSDRKHHQRAVGDLVRLVVAGVATTGVVSESGAQSSPSPLPL